MEVKYKPRLVVVSPFLDKSYGTERAVIEWISPLVEDYEIHIYSQRVEDLDLSKFIWHRVPRLRGPHLLNFVWWYIANQLWRAWDVHVHGLRPDIVYSPGINCPNADVISVHIVFAEFVRQSAQQLRFARTSPRFWPRLLHRKLYYRLIIFLEGRTYSDSEIALVLYAQKTAADIQRFYGRHDRCLVLYLGVDHGTFNPDRRKAARENARQQLSINKETFVFLLVGNDLEKKGIRVLTRAFQELRGLRVLLLVASREDSQPFQDLVRQAHLEDRVMFLPARKDVIFYYAAADAYVGPSLEDTFALPPVEAMACGLPVIVSRENGTSEIIRHGVNGLILEDSTDADSLAAMVRSFAEDPQFAKNIAEKGAETARGFTWESNVREIKSVFEEILRRKDSDAEIEVGDSKTRGTAL
jgi:glycosyltransferase involved in cell wall biosynthesis